MENIHQNVNSSCLCSIEFQGSSLAWIYFAMNMYYFSEKEEKMYSYSSELYSSLEGKLFYLAAVLSFQSPHLALAMDSMSYFV